MHVMLDLETLATDNNAFIVSLGAVKFNKDGLYEEFYSNISLEENPYEFTLNPSTVKWWLNQGKEAQIALFSNAKPLKEVLEAFSDFYLGRYNITGKKGKEVWGNGSPFDNVILRNAYNKLKLDCPWHFRYDRCFRTVKYLYPELNIEFIGTRHHALTDAKNQATYLIELAKSYKLELK